MKNLVAGTKFCPRDMSRNSNQFELRGHVAATKQRYTPVKRKVASCELFMRHVPATLRKINQSENKITTGPCDKTLRVNTSTNLSPQHAPSCERRMKYFPAKCPCNMSPRVSRPYRTIDLEPCRYIMDQIYLLYYYYNIIMYFKVEIIVIEIPKGCMSKVQLRERFLGALSVV